MHGWVINTVLDTNAKHSTMGGAVGRVNSVPARLNTESEEILPGRGKRTEQLSSQRQKTAGMVPKRCQSTEAACGVVQRRIVVMSMQALV